MKPLVAIVGRPNVGKSTLFNRLVGRRIAIVENRPGVTRDRQYADAAFNDREFTVIDTGGFVPDEKDQLLARVREQALFAVQECDVILLVVDARAGLMAADELVMKELRRSGKPLVIAANKVDTTKMESDGVGSDFFRLGTESLFMVSAEHGRGTEDLLERVVSLLPPKEEEPPAFEENPENRPIRIAIVGRPNVGKSTLVNALLKEDRMVAADLPGTTRDAIDSALTFQNRDFILTDTAGIRRKSTIAQTVEQFAVVGSLRAIDQSDVAVMVLDAEEPGVDQDAKIISVAEEKGRALLVVINKWDKLAGKTKEKDFREELKHTLRFVSFAPQVFTTAIDGGKVEKVLELSRMLFDRWQFRAPTPALNRLLKHVTENHPLPFAHGKPLRLYYIAQVAAAPPTFTVTCNRPEGIPDRYKRYLINQLRETFDLKVPIRLFFRERPGKEKRALKLEQMKNRRKLKEKARH